MCVIFLDKCAGHRQFRIVDYCRTIIEQVARLPTFTLEQKRKSQTPTPLPSLTEHIRPCNTDQQPTSRLRHNNKLKQIISCNSQIFHANFEDDKDGNTELVWEECEDCSNRLHSTLLTAILNDPNGGREWHDGEKALGKYANCSYQITIKYPLSISAKIAQLFITDDSTSIENHEEIVAIDEPETVEDEQPVNCMPTELHQPTPSDGNTSDHEQQQTITKHHHPRKRPKIVYDSDEEDTIVITKPRVRVAKSPRTLPPEYTVEEAPSNLESIYPTPPPPPPSMIDPPTSQALIRKLDKLSTTSKAIVTTLVDALDVGGENLGNKLNRLKAAIENLQAGLEVEDTEDGHVEA